MRLAVVAASTYEENGQVAPIPNAKVDVELFGGRLAETDAGFRVYALAARRGLAEGLDELIASLGERPRALVFYFWGYALLSEEHGPTLLLDGPKLSPLSLAGLRRQLCEVADVALAVLDTSLAAGSFGAPLDAVRAMGRALSGGDSSVSSLIAAALPAPRAVQGPPPFTGLVQMILDAQLGSTVDLTPDALFRAMQSEEVLFSDIPAAGCFVSRRNFVIVPGAGPISVPPSARRSTDEETGRRGLVPLPLPLPPPLPLLPPLPRSLSPSPMPRLEALSPPASGRSVAPPLPSPSAAQHYRGLLAEFERVQDRDGAYRAALCLEALGEADENQSLLVTTHRPSGLQAVREVLSYADWHERLCAGCHEPHTAAVLRALGPALVRVGFQHARRLHRQPALPDEARQDPEKSTTTLVKTLHWATRLLCVPATELYVLAEVPGAIALVPGSDRPLLTCARSLGSGFSLPELVGLWARELSFARPEEVALCYFPSPNELSQLLLAALAVGGTASLRTIDGEGKRLASLLKREVRGAALDALRAAAQSFPFAELSLRVSAFMRGAEFVALRAALVACGDLQLSLGLDQRFPRIGLTESEDRRADLLRFTVSPEFGRIRNSLGVALS